MIKIGNVYINPDEVAAMYPSIHTEGKIWIVLKGGNRVYTFADIEEVRQALCTEGINFDTSETMQAIELYYSGFRFIARDREGGACAFEKRPSRGDEYWNPPGGSVQELGMSAFPRVTWGDEPLSLYDFLRGEGA